MLMKTFKITTFGCRVNQAESRQMGEQITKAFSLKPADSYNKANLVVINTCCVTNKAEKEVRSEIRRAKKENPDCFLIAAGCWTEKIKKHSKEDKQQPELLKLIDLLILNNNKNNLVKIIKNKKQISKKGFRSSKQKQYKDKYSKSNKALIKVQTGCNNFCTYCIVPYVRGRSKSRKINKVIKEIKEKEKQGIKEIILTGIDISDYKPSLVQLIKKILNKTNIKKISFGSINLEAFDKKLMNLFSVKEKKPRLTKHFHIPIQSGSNQTLKRMNRKYNVEQFIKTIKKIKKNIPNFSFSTDIIVGFPGETKEEFEQTLRTIKQLKIILNKDFTRAHIFRYSPKKGTIAEIKEGKKEWKKVDEKEKKTRAQAIKDSL